MTTIDDLIAEFGLSDDLKLYHILAEEEYGWAVIQREGGYTLTLDEIDSLIDHLVGYRIERLHRQIKEEFQIYYPCELPYISSGTDTRRPADAKRYSGVYFAKHPDYPGMVKIGYSIDVYERMRGLFIEFGKKPLTVVGFIESQKGRQTETLIHKALKEHRHKGEWFDDTGALSWLKGLMQ